MKYRTVLLLLMLCWLPSSMLLAQAKQEPAPKPKVQSLSAAGVPSGQAKMSATAPILTTTATPVAAKGAKTAVNPEVASLDEAILHLDESIRNNPAQAEELSKKRAGLIQHREKLIKQP
ncbi:MAG: hypothetical protein ABI432_18415 [Flavobacteriales bacterium]